MQILTLENQSFKLNDLPDEIDDLRFCVLDNSNPKDPDYFFIPLIFLESFNSPALVLKIGNNHIKMPLDWRILIGDPEVGDLEVVALSELNDRDFHTFVFNPLDGFKPHFEKIEIMDAYQNVRWYFPKLRSGQLLCVPLEDGKNPDCAFFVREITRQNEIVDVEKVW